MSRTRIKRSGSKPAPREPARVFAALGDSTRLALALRLAAGERRSIAQLTDGTDLTRQAITKHLRVLEEVGIVHSLKSGRETLYEFDPGPFRDASEYLRAVSEAWNRVLTRLKDFVESGPDET